MTGDHGHHQVESGARLNGECEMRAEIGFNAGFRLVFCPCFCEAKRRDYSHKHKDKHKDKEHRHKDHKKDKEREKSKYTNSSNGKHKREKENGYVSHIKTEEDNGYGYSPMPEKPMKRDRDEDELEHKPKKIKVEKENKVKKRKQEEEFDYYDEDVKPKKKSKGKKDDSAGGGKKKAKKEPEEKWKWWEEERCTDGSKWRFLEHKGPVFAPPYERLPENVRFYYDGKVMKLSEQAEEVATFFAKMLDHEYTTKDIFRKNFFKDWRKEMTSEEKSKISDLNKCNFTEMSEFFKAQSEARKQMSKEEKQKNKEENERLVEEYGFCLMDNHKERIGNFRIEPPGLFRGRGDHPKMGMLKRRIRPEDIIINCSKDSKHPKPPPGTKWKEVRHDNKVTWLASWTENIQGSIKYIMLNPSSRIKGEKDWQKYETARRLKKCVEKIRAQYREDWKSKEMRIRQRAVALYFIDKLALRAGNEKEEGESADTVGCCSLRVEHINLHPEMDGQEFVVELDFLGKDSIRYYNKIPVEKRVFKNLQLFLENKQLEDDVFDRLNTSILNKHLQELMDGLTAKVFRTYNASITLQQQLDQLTNPEDNLPAKILSYNRANRAVAILCNHQRAPPKTFEKSMQNLQAKIDAKKKQISAAKKELKSAKADAKAMHDEKSRKSVETKKKAVQRLSEQLMKLEVQATDREENKQIALGTSKLNYLDPRISVACRYESEHRRVCAISVTRIGFTLVIIERHCIQMRREALETRRPCRGKVLVVHSGIWRALPHVQQLCKKWGIPIEKIYNKTQREKFAWAIDMADNDYQF
ncbi:DNA topoisomerase 1 [Silurus asotus]|uniref:DNA topoisomerase I n=1 Tax=Silurus asotus TaxID=30991 RepID=A0AAD5A9D2_SILAS|nr:DNA topoisomerase 1 [Silurus asotus]